MPFFSVIIPIYKTEKYLAECVESVLSQTFGDFELILVDDGSPDGCPAMCDAYAARDERVKVVHKENGGLVSARIAGVGAAVGDYVVYLDSDDRISPDMLREFGKAIDGSSPDIVLCGKYISDGDRNEPVPVGIPAGVYGREDIEREFFPMLIQKPDATYFPPSLWAKAFRRGLLAEYQQKVDKKLKIGEDGACTVPCVYHANTVAVLDVLLYYYRVNRESMTKSRKPFDWDGPRLIAETLEKSVDMTEYGFGEQLARKTAHELFSVAVSRFYGGDGYLAAKRDILAHLDEPFYRDAVKNCAFSGSKKAKFMETALKKRLIFPMYLYSKIK